MSFKEGWTKKFAESLTKDEKKAFRLWLDFSEGRGACIQGLVHIQLHRSSTRTRSTGYAREVRTLFWGNHRERCNSVR